MPVRLAVVAIFCAATVIGIAAEQVGGTRFSRFGAVGESLSERDLEQIAELAKAAGKPVWLLLGFRPLISGVTTLEVYLQPDTSSERLRRGRILLVAAETPLVASEKLDWKVKGTKDYAYVPPAGQLVEIVSERDISWPFAVTGDIDDDTLISLVTFVRSKPPVPGVPEGSGPREVPGAPLFGVWRVGDEFMVALRLQENAYVFRVTLVRKDGRWIVAKWNASVA
jgi:hypothetical protein